MDYQTQTIAPCFADILSGVWVVGVSGHADSTALLHGVLKFAPQVTPVLAHLNHQLRGHDAQADADLIRQTAKTCGLELFTATLPEVLAQMPGQKPANRPALYRAARHHLFRQAADEHKAKGVLLAHHADDLAETVLLRLLRGHVPPAKLGIAPVARLPAAKGFNPLIARRPLLNVGKEQLLSFLQDEKISFRTDATNAQPISARNRARAYLQTRPELSACLIRLAQTSDAYRHALLAAAPVLQSNFTPADILDLPGPVARAALSRLFAHYHLPAGALSRSRLEQVMAFLHDRASGQAHSLPGSFQLRRKGKQIWLVPPQGA